MTTYANEAILKWTILTVTIINLIIGIVLTVQATFNLVLESQSYKLHPVMTDQHEMVKYKNDLADRFPSAGSNSVKLTFGLTTTLAAIIGIIAVVTKNVRLLHCHGLFSFLSFFIKYLFIFASLKMYNKNYDYNPIAHVSVQLCIFVGIFELFIGMCSCHTAKILKRAGGGVPQIKKWPTGDK